MLRNFAHHSFDKGAHFILKMKKNARIYFTTVYSFRNYDYKEEELDEIVGVVFSSILSTLNGILIIRIQSLLRITQGKRGFKERPTAKNVNNIYKNVPRFVFVFLNEMNDVSKLSHCVAEIRYEIHYVFTLLEYFE